MPRKRKNGGRVRTYRISFRDGTAYIGSTKQPVEDRVAQHRSAANTHNRKLRDRLRREKHPTVIVLRAHPTRADAQRDERARIRKARKELGSKLLNKQLPKKR